MSRSINKVTGRSRRYNCTIHQWRVGDKFSARARRRMIDDTIFEMENDIDVDVPTRAELARLSDGALFIKWIRA